jgi:hypothetical protein
MGHVPVNGILRLTWNIVDVASQQQATLCNPPSEKQLRLLPVVSYLMI